MVLAMLLAGAPANASEPVSVPEPTASALAYHCGKDLFWLAGEASLFVLPALLLFTGWSSRLRTWCGRLVGGRWYPTLALYGGLYVLIGFLFGAPLAFLEGYVFEHVYD